MRTIGANLQTHLNGGRTTLAVLWQLSRVRDAVNVVAVTAASEANIETDLPHGLSAGDSVRLVSLEGTVSAMNRNVYRVQSVVDSTHFTVNYDSTAKTHTANTGKVQPTFGVTNSVVDIDYGNVNYKARTGTFPTQKKQAGDGSVGNMEMEVAPVAPFTIADVYGGMWDGARTRVMLVNYRDLTMGHIDVLTGWVGMTSVADNKITIELRDLAQAIQQEIGDKVVPYCRAQVGDTRCGVDLSLYDDTGSITTVTDQITLIDSASVKADGYFTGGQIKFLTGANAGLVVDVVSFASKTFVLAYRLPGTVVVGDTYYATIGCDKKLSTCKNTFNNVANFRGEPHVPLPESVMKYGQNV